MNPNKDKNTLHIDIYTQETTINIYKQRGMNNDGYLMIHDDD